MGAGTVIAVALGAGGLYLLARRNRAPEPAAGGGGTSKCDALESISPTAAAACRAASGVLDLAGALHERHMNKNVELNGPFASVPMPLLYQLGYEMFGDRNRYPYAGQHANGCQPFQGAPGWSKCAPGTNAFNATYQAGTHFGEYGTGLASDPLTRAWGDYASGHQWPGDACAPGARRYWVGGKATCCASVDHRAGKPVCAPQSDRSTSLPTSGTTTGTGTRGSGDTTDYVWVPNPSEPAGGHWERPRAGQTTTTRTTALASGASRFGGL